MSATLEPRQVEKPFWKRWLRMTWQLFVRSPVRFGILIALLGWVDTSAVNLAQGFVIPRIWVERLGMLLLPALFALVSAIARGADDASQTWTALRALAGFQLWFKALVAGATLVALNWVVYQSMDFLFNSSAVASHPLALSNTPGALLETIAAQTWMVIWCLGICYSPLVVFWPELSLKETKTLSLTASNVNDRGKINSLIIGVLFCGLPIELIPAYGMTEAALLVFMGTLTYVAYRDIFERRDENLPAPVAARRGIGAQIST